MNKCQTSCEPGAPPCGSRMECQKVQTIKEAIFTILRLPRSYPRLLRRPAAHRLSTENMAANAEGEQHYGPRSHEGLDDDDFYLNFLRQVTHYPDDYYHHGRSAAVNTLPLIQDNPPLSYVDDGPLSATAESPDFELRSSLGLSHNRQDLPERASFTERPSPPSPLKPFSGVHDPLLTMVALGSSPEFPLFANVQVRPHAS